MDHTPDYNDEQNYQRNTLWDFFPPGDFGRKHQCILLAAGLSAPEARFLNRLLNAFSIFGEADMPMNEHDAERFAALADRAMDVA